MRIFQLYILSFKIAVIKASELESNEIFAYTSIYNKMY